MTDRPKAKCNGCGRTPDQIPEYIYEARALEMTPEDWIWREEGTLNPSNGHFLCTECYVKEGMPSAPSGWIAP